jgi:hypothetical protein
VLLPRFGVVVYKTYFNKIISKTSVKLRIEDLDLGASMLKFTEFFEIIKKSCEF